MNGLIKKSIAECVGTFLLVFFAVGVACLTNSVIATSLAFGLVLIVNIFLIGPLTGCHLNPAVSIAMVTNGKMSFKDFIGYIIGQFAGSILASTILYAVFAMSGVHIWSWGVNLLIGGAYSVGSIIASFIVEVILTAVFVYIIIEMTSKEEHSKIAPFIIGIVLCLVHLIGFNLTGTSVNPARSFGPALMSMIFGGGATAFGMVWVFLLAPLGGGVLASFAYKMFHDEVSEEELAAAREKRELEREKTAQERAEKAAKKAEKDEEKRLEKAEKAANKLKTDKKSKVVEDEEDDDEDEYEDDEEYEDDDEYEDEEYEDDDEYEDDEDEEEDE